MSRELKCVLSIIGVPFVSFDFPRHWNTLECVLSMVVILWRHCSSQRLSNRLEIMHSYICPLLRMMILPNAIDLSNVGIDIIRETVIYRIAETAGVEYRHFMINESVTAELTNGCFVIWTRCHSTNFITILPSQLGESMTTSPRREWQRFCAWNRSDLWYGTPPYPHDESQCSSRIHRSTSWLQHRSYLLFG